MPVLDCSNGESGEKSDDQRCSISVMHTLCAYAICSEMATYDGGA